MKRKFSAGEQRRSSPLTSEKRHLPLAADSRPPHGNCSERNKLMGFNKNRTQRGVESPIFCNQRCCQSFSSTGVRAGSLRQRDPVETYIREMSSWIWYFKTQHKAIQCYRLWPILVGWARGGQVESRPAGQPRW